MLGRASGGLVGVDPVTMKNQFGHSDRAPSGGQGVKTSTTINYYVAGLQDAQLRAVDAMVEAFFKPVLGKGEGATGLNTRIK